MWHLWQVRVWVWHQDRHIYLHVSARTAERAKQIVEERLIGDVEEVTLMPDDPGTGNGVAELPRMDWPAFEARLVEQGITPHG